jgi:uncharacterized protein (TIGR02246 family)
MPGDDEMRAIYRGLLDAWNGQDAAGFAAPFLDDGLTIGFDGSRHKGRDTIERELGAIFADHQTGTYIGKVRDARAIGQGAGMLHADVGMQPPGGSDLKPELTSRQTLVVEERDGQWRIVLFQTTPAQLHGRPEDLEALTDELRQELRAPGA